MANLFDPPQKWANIADCGNWPCTAPKNALFKFTNTQFSGQITQIPNGPELGGDFQIIANNSGFAPYAQGCTAVPTWNSYICQNNELGVLLFESEDEDKEDRSIQPVYVQL